MPARTPPPLNDNTTDQLAELPMAFEWRRCPVHPALAVSVIVIANAGPWCVGADEVNGHWVDEQVTA